MEKPEDKVSQTPKVEALSDAKVNEIVADLGTFNNRKFGQVDTTQDGFITIQELDRATKNETLTDNDLAIANAAKNNSDRIQQRNNDDWGWDNDGFSRQDFAELSTHVAAYVFESREREAMTSLVRGHFDNFPVSESQAIELEKSKELSAAEKEMATNLRTNFSSMASKYDMFGRPIAFPYYSLADQMKPFVHGQRYLMHDADLQRYQSVAVHRYPIGSSFQTNIKY